MGQPLQMSPYKETIWIVDDSVTDAERASQALRGDYDVKIFHDGPEALEKLVSSPPPDLLMLDWVMPGMSGLEICAYVRSATTEIARLPIILLTSQAGKDEIEEAFKVGANDYILKPFVTEELRARVKTLTSSKRHLQRAQALVTELQRSEERLLIATSSAGVGIWEWDIGLGLIASTEIHRKMFELPLSGLIQFREMLEKIHADDRGRVEATLMNAVETKADSEVEFRLVKQDGSIAWIHGHGRVVADVDGQRVRMLGIHRDITKQKEIESELKRAKEGAEKASQLKSSFLANMSHEIRTPLGAMMGFAQLMTEPMITEIEIAEYLGVLIRNGEQLSVIINDILDLSKVEAGLLTYELREFDSQLICNEAVALFKAKAKEQKLILEFKADPSTPSKVVSDPTRLRQILMNLVSNALKFTKFGSVTVETSGRVIDGKNKLVIEVHDTGIGISPENAERIFEMFVQADESTTRKFGGTGIGLALSRQLARNLGGELSLVGNTRAGGSIFQISVLNHPKSEVLTTAEMPVNSAQPVTSLDGIRVLVVDDAPDNQHLLTRYLSKRGALVEVASNGMEGYQKAISKSFDVVLMDLQMPHMDGYATTRKLRDVGYEKPIIALTAHAMSEISAKCIEAGCDGYLPKPINPTALVETIAQFAPRN